MDSELADALVAIEAKVDRLFRYLVSITDACPDCKGMGWYPSAYPHRECSGCAGSGRVPRGRGGEG